MENCELAKQMINRLREEFGLTQSEIADQIGVTRQSLRRWLKSETTPSPEIVERLKNLEERAETGTISRFSQDVLPLYQLTPPQFENFCLDFAIDILGLKDAQLFGRPGDKQFGIDILSESTKTAIQCKRTISLSYSEQMFRKVVDEYDERKWHYTISRKILMLSTEAGRRIYDLAKEQGWVIYDIRRITRTLRDPNKQDIIIGLLRNYFVDYRRILEKCANIHFGTALLTKEEFFFESDKEDNLFSHTGKYIMQDEEEFNRIIKQINDKDNTPILISAPGGIGKTRLIKELCEKSRKTFYFVNDDNEIKEEDLNDLSSASVLAIDDAHEKMMELRKVLSYWKSRKMQNEPVFKILIATRSYATEDIKSLLSVKQKNKFYAYELKPLKDSKAVELINSISRNLKYEAELINIAGGSPLILTVGARSILKYNTFPKLLNSEDGVKKVLSQYFRSFFIDPKMNGDKQRQITKTLEYISITQPITTDRNSLRRCAKYSDLHESEVEDAIERLKVAGILRDFGNSMKISPDLLSDYILENALKDFASNKLERILENRTSDDVVNVIRNISQLEWRKKETNEHDEQLRNIIEHFTTEQYASSDERGKIELLEQMASVAFYQPEIFLNLVSNLLEAITDGKNIEKSYDLSLEILKSILYDGKWLQQSLVLAIKAYEFANRNGINNKPIVDLLRGIVAYTIDKPIHYIEKTINFLVDYTRKNSNFPIENILEEVLKIHCSPTVPVSKYAINIYQFDVIQKNVATVRRVAMDMVFERIVSSDIRQSFSTADVLKYAIFEMESSDKKTAEGWRKERAATLTRLGDQIQGGKVDILIVAELYKDLSGYIDEEEEKTAFGNVVADENFRIALMALDRWGDRFMRKAEFSEHQKYLKIADDWNNDVAKEALITHNDSNKLIDELFELEEKMKKAKNNLELNIENVIGRFCDLNIDFSKNLLSRIWSDRIIKEKFGPYAHYAVKKLLETDCDALSDLSHMASSNDAGLRVSVIIALWSCEQYLSEDEALELFFKLSKQLTDAEVDTLFNSLSRLSEEKTAFIITVVRTILHSNNTKWICKTLNFLRLPFLKIKLSGIITKELEEKIENAIIDVEDLDDGGISFLRTYSKTNPDKVIKIFKQRIENEFDGGHFKTPIPYHAKLNVDDETKQHMFLEVLKWFNEPDKKSHLTWHFRQMLDFIDVDKDIITNEIEHLIATRPNNYSNKIKSLTECLGITSIWGKQERIESLASKLYKELGLEELENFAEALYYSYLYAELHCRNIGEPDRNLKKLRDFSEKNKINQKPELMRFYSILEKKASEEIERDSKRDEQLEFRQ